MPTSTRPRPHRPRWPTSSGSVPSGPSCTRRSWCDPPPDARRSDSPAAVLRSRQHREPRRTTARCARTPWPHGRWRSIRPARRRAPDCGPPRRRWPRRAPRSRRLGARSISNGCAISRACSRPATCSTRSRDRTCSSLFPVTLEARLDPGRLRIRVWPDAISTSTHDPRLTPREAGGRAAGTGARRRWPRTRPNRGRHGGRWRR